MENIFEIHLGHGEQRQTFEVKDFTDRREGQCKFEIYRTGQLLVSLEPEGDMFRTCSNPGNLDAKVISQLIDQIEAQYL